MLIATLPGKFSKSGADFITLRDPKHREVQWLNQSHTAVEQWSANWVSFTQASPYQTLCLVEVEETESVCLSVCCLTLSFEPDPFILWFSESLGWQFRYVVNPPSPAVSPLQHPGTVAASLVFWGGLECLFPRQSCWVGLAGKCKCVNESMPKKEDSAAHETVWAKGREERWRGNDREIRGQRGGKGWVKLRDREWENAGRAEKNSCVRKRPNLWGLKTVPVTGGEERDKEGWCGEGVGIRRCKNLCAQVAIFLELFFIFVFYCENIHKNPDFSF